MKKQKKYFVSIFRLLQRQHGFKSLGPADGAVKNAISGGNSVRLY